MSVEFAVIGGGNMGAALLGGALAAGVLDPTQVAIVEPVAARREHLSELFAGVSVVDTVPRCASALLAVKPQYISQVAIEAVAAGATRLLSIAAGVTSETIAEAAGPGVAIVRAMPNTPALVGEGVSAITGAADTDAADLDWAESILSGVGLVVRVAEAQFDAVTGLTGSGPAYVFLVAEALMDAGVAAGLSRDVVEPMVTQLLVGSSRLLADRGNPAGLRAMVTSPGGTTAAGVSVLENRAVRGAMIEAVRAAAIRSRELGNA